jgi:hypothetical protein
VKSLRVKYPLFLSDFNETCIFWTDFERIINIKFHQNPSSESDVVPCGQTDMTNLTVSLRNFAKEPKREFLHDFRYFPRIYQPNAQGKSTHISTHVPKACGHVIYDSLKKRTALHKKQKKRGNLRVT